MRPPGGQRGQVFEVAGLWQLALSQLEDLQRQQVEANVKTYNSAISACGKAAQWQRCLQLLKQTKLLRWGRDGLVLGSFTEKSGTHGDVDYITVL